MNINEKLLTVLDHSLMTNEEFAEDDELVPGVTISEVKEMIKMLQPIEGLENYTVDLQQFDKEMNEALEHYYTKVEGDSYDVTGRELQSHDMKVTFGNKIHTIYFNADSYDDMGTLIRNQIQGNG